MRTVKLCVNARHYSTSLAPGNTNPAMWSAAHAEPLSQVAFELVCDPARSIVLSEHSLCELGEPGAIPHICAKSR